MFETIFKKSNKNEQMLEIVGLCFENVLIVFCCFYQTHHKPRSKTSACIKPMKTLDFLRSSFNTRELDTREIV